MISYRDYFDEAMIGAYMEGKLSAEEKAGIDRYCALSQELKEELGVIDSLLKDTDRPESDAPPEYVIHEAIGFYPKSDGLIDAVVRLAKNAVKIITHLEDVSIIVPTAAQALRAAEAISPTMVILRKSFEKIDAECYIEKVSGGLCTMKVVISDKGAGTYHVNIRVEVRARGRVLVSGLLERGELLLEDIVPGRYTIDIRANGQTLGQIALKIK